MIRIFKFGIGNPYHKDLKKIYRSKIGFCKKHMYKSPALLVTSALLSDLINLQKRSSIDKKITFGDSGLRLDIPKKSLTGKPCEFPNRNS